MWLCLLWGVCTLQVFCGAQQWAAWRWLQTPRAPHRAQLPLASPAVTVACGPDRMVVTVRRDLFGVGKPVAPTDLALGGTFCPPVSFDSAADLVVFEAGLHECGSVLQMTPDLLIYQTRLYYTPSPAANQVIVRANAAEIPIECRYPRKENITSKAIKPTWTPFRSALSAEARLKFSLQLMSEDWSAERTSTTFQLGDVLCLQAEVKAENHLPLRLFVDSCVAHLSPETTSRPQYSLVDFHGCLVDGRQAPAVSSSTFLSPRPWQAALRFTVKAFRFAGDARNVIYITCHLKATPMDQAPDAQNKACSFNAASNTWLPVEGSRDICGCCESGDCGGTWEEHPRHLGPRPRPLAASWQRSMPADTAPHRTWLAVGPLLVSDPQESFGEFPGDPEDGEEMAREEFIPVVAESQMDAAGSRSLFREQEGSANFSEDQRLEPVMPLGAYVRGGPSFFSGGQDGSGFGDRGEAAIPEERSRALEFRAGVVSRPLEEAVSSSGKLPAEAASVTAEGLAEQSGTGLGLSLLTAGLSVALLALGVSVLVKRCRPSSPSQRSP
ncbi:zona pellucida sperm-binding protein 3-like [Hemicordylus capensis]|uniref:zona pellucida sperm-binding protein 3-like n=1 Tax=Hemicordylus capensis TaxID=884348 RepID=UPI002304664A|nr:zona pellucida sperm-binding protein 3-like [Hemicordylus capensis]